MLFRKKSVLCASLFVLPFVSAHAEDAHVHGLANLSIAQDKNTVLMELISPADSVVGVEAKPTEAQWLNIVERETLLRSATLVSLDGCKNTEFTLESPFDEHEEGHDEHEEEHDEHEEEHDEHEEDHDEHEEDHDEHEEEHDEHEEEHDEHEEHHDEHEEGHSEYHMSWTFDCATQPKWVSVNVFDQFIDLEKLNVEWFLENQQSQKQITSADTKVQF